jgi:hypothetical protein
MMSKAKHKKEKPPKPVRLPESVAAIFSDLNNAVMRATQNRDHYIVGVKMGMGLPATSQFDIGQMAFVLPKEIKEDDK